MYLDRDMSVHVTQLVCSCWDVLRQLRSIRRSLPLTALTTLVSSFIMSKVDYCNVVLADLLQHLLDHVQSVVNAAAHLSADAHSLLVSSRSHQFFLWLMFSVAMLMSTTRARSAVGPSLSLAQRSGTHCQTSSATHRYRLTVSVASLNHSCL